MKFQYNDGGRKDAGYKGFTGDCGTRAIAIVTGLSYQTVYEMVNDLGRSGKGFKQRKTGKISNPNGIESHPMPMHKEIINHFIVELVII
jgi:hypothetical protein